jgi:hypothetical protein
MQLNFTDIFQFDHFEFSYLKKQEKCSQNRVKCQCHQHSFTSPEDDKLQMSIFLHMHV